MQLHNNKLRHRLPSKWNNTKLTSLVASNNKHLGGALLYYGAVELRRGLLARALQIVPARRRQRVATLQARVSTCL